MALEFLQLPEESSVRVPSDDVHAQIVALLTTAGVNPRYARITADALVCASLRGVDTHGVPNATRYTNLIMDGTYNADQEVKVLNETATTALLTCDDGLGFPAAHIGMELAIEKAAEHGLGMSTIRDGHHIGMVGYYSLLPLERDMIGMAMTNAGPSVRPALGARPRLGTNPIAFAAPGGDEGDFTLDMATSTVASGKLGLAARLGVPVPEGWAVGAEGEPLTEPPGDRGEHWSQNPLGNTREQGAHKGYGLAVMVDILCGVLSGGGYSYMIGSGNNMSWTMAIDVAAFRPVDEFKAMMDDMMRELRATPTEAGADSVMVAGDPERETMAEREANGIPILQAQYDEMVSLARRIGADVLI